VEVTCAVVVPAGHGIDEAGGVDFADIVREYAIDACVVYTVVAFPGLAPALVVDNLFCSAWCISHAAPR
jgi:hypothetical protein